MFRWGKEAGAIRRGAVPGRGFWFGQEIHLEVDIFPNGNTISTPMADLPKQRAHLQIGTSSGRIGAYEIRRAQSSDVGEIASAHRDSIQSLGPKFYSPELLEYWQEGITGELYLKAMEAGEVFFVAVGEADGSRVVLGFASDYRVAGPKHGTSVYVPATRRDAALVRPFSQRQKPTPSRTGQRASKSRRRSLVPRSTRPADLWRLVAAKPG
jgi:hypothetical protein